MGKQVPFIPGQLEAPKPPLAHYRPRTPVGAATEYVRSLTTPGGLVVDLFCQGPRFVREAIEAGRRVLGLSVNPLLLQAARVGLTAVDCGALNAAFTRLTDTLKGDEPLGSYLSSLYRSHCPICDASGTAEWFAWRQDIDRPFEKAVRCGRCGRVQVGPTDEEDLARVRRFAARGLPYYYALDRAAPLGHPVRERAAELVHCYTPRNLSALMDLSRRLEGLEMTASVRVALTALLLDCYDRCSKLHPYDADRPRPRTLRIPVRYLERNVWLCLEDGLSGFGDRRTATPVPEARSLDEVIRDGRQGYALAACAARDVGDILPLGSADLVLVEPPRPDGAFWALSALWAAWLWNSSQTRAMRPFLRRRRFDWHWYWQVLRKAFSAVGPRLAEDGLVITLFTDQEPSMLPSVCLAAAGAGYRLAAWGYAPEVGYRFIWSWEGQGGRQSAVVEGLESAVSQVAEEATLGTLRRRGEPTSEAMLNAAAYAGVVERDLLKSVTALDDPTPLAFLSDTIDQGISMAPITEVPSDGERSPQLWWLLHPWEATDTLTDRVEKLVRRLLAERLVWYEGELINAVYERFGDVQTPDLTLVRVCVASYGIHEGHEVRLRPEDDLERRRREVDNVRHALVGLGRRLAFRTDAQGPWDVRWLDDDQETYVFSVSATAALASSLLDGATSNPETHRCLVVPGGRAGLIDLKLQRDPRLASVVESGRWQFIKFRHLRRLVAEEDLDRYALRIVLGLDPIAEQEHTQLTLL